MTTKLHSVLVEVDETANVVRIWRQYAGDVPSPFRLLELPLDQLPTERHREVAAVFGEAVLGGLADTHATLAAYRSESQDGMEAPDMRGAVAAILLRALAGDLEAQSGYATILAQRSLARLEPAYLEEAEEWYRKAAARDNTAATWLRETWPRVKQHTASEIAKRRGDSAKPAS